MSRVKLLALFVLVVGGACMSLFTFAIYFSYTFILFAPVATRDEVLGNGSIIGAVPLITGAIMLLFARTQKPGARVTLLGSVVLTLYLVFCYFRLSFDSMELTWKMLWFAVFPVAVATVDWTAYKIHRLVLPPAQPKTVAATAGQ